MSIRHLINTTYQETVALADVDPELKRSLRTSDRVPAMIHNLEREINRLPMRLQTRANIVATVTDLTQLFLRSTEQLARERHLSDAARSAMRAASEKQALEDKIADDMIEGKEIDAERIAEVTDG